MSLDAFLHNLHFDTEKTRPLDWEVDWQNAPLAYKLYRGLPVVPLSPEVPFRLERRETAATPGLDEIGSFLWYVYGLNQVSQTVLDPKSREYETGSLQSYRRFVPSGGALYPSELYVYLKMADVPVGVYHYDVAHHRLVLLREGNFDSYLARALGNRCDVHSCFGAVFVSTMFWKNFFKYNNFAYRLQGMDAGVLIGQLLEVAKRIGFATGVYFQFLDRAVNHLLGVSEAEESVYAVIPLSVDPSTVWFACQQDRELRVSADELRLELPPVHHRPIARSHTGSRYPLLIHMNEASMLESPQAFRQIGKEKSEKAASCADDAVVFPQVNRIPYDFYAACRRRYSPEGDFLLRKISREQLAAFLREATTSFSYRNDLDEADENHEARVFLYGCVYHVEGVPDGAYRYDSDAHALYPIRPGDHRQWLQQGMSLDNVNLFQVPLCLHVAGDRDHLKAALGYRGYRIQQMEAGMLVQRILLAASAIGWGGHALLGFDANSADELYQLGPQRTTSLIQIPVGPHRPRARLEGSLHG